MKKTKRGGMQPSTKTSVVHIYAGSGAAIHVVVNSDHAGSIPSEKSVAGAVNAIKSARAILIAFFKCIWHLING